MNEDGSISHVDIINHCLPYAFGECTQEHYTRCMMCDQLFDFIEKLITIFPEHLQATVEESKNKLYYFLAHQARKFYLNNQFKAKLLELDKDGAILM